MKSPAVVLKVLGIFFIVLGTVWFSFIKARCIEISPRPALSKATMVVSGTVSNQPPKIRSPYATIYHDYTFWAIAIIEVFTAIAYGLAGIFLLRSFVLTKYLVALALGLHIILMIIVIAFMKVGAIPLSDVTHNPNMLQLYFLPSERIHNIFSVFVTGFRFYLPGGPFYMVGVVLYFYLCYFVLSRPEVKSYLALLKKA